MSVQRAGVSRRQQHRHSPYGTSPGAYQPGGFTHPQPAGPAPPPPFIPLALAPAPGPRVAVSQTGQYNTFDEAITAPAVLQRLGQTQTFSLIDGQNFFNKVWAGGPYGDTTDVNAMVQWTNACMSADRSRVVIVYPMRLWIDKGLSGLAADVPRQLKLKELMRLVEPLRQPGTSVVVFLLMYPYEQVDKQDAPAGARKERVCKMGNMREHTHLACEVDDLFLTMLRCELLKNNRTVHVVSKDRLVVKTPTFEQNAIRRHMADAGWTFQVAVEELFFEDHS